MVTIPRVAVTPTPWAEGRDQIMLRFHVVTCCLSCLACLGSIGCQRRELVSPFSSERVELTKQSDGQIYHVVDNGNVYREVESGKNWEYFATIFDPDEVARSYVTENGVTYRVAPDSDQRYAVMRDLDESFEDLSPGLPGVAEIVAPPRLKWGSFTLQSPQSPTVTDYVELRKELIEGRTQLGDCRIEPTSEKAHSGKMSLKCVAPAKPSNMITCKASLSTPLPYFRNGDDFWFEAWYWIEGTLPLTLVDLESEFIEQHAGIRVRIYEDGTLGAELKALDKPQFRQPEGKQTLFPDGRWVRVRVHYQLAVTDGTIEIWQDDKLVLSCPGQTLPFRSAIYNSLEVGITAHSDPSGACQLYMDDLRMSPHKFTD